jgi:hypothetical protein
MYHHPHSDIIKQSGSQRSICNIRLTKQQNPLNADQISVSFWKTPRCSGKSRRHQSQVEGCRWDCPTSNNSSSICPHCQECGCDEFYNVFKSSVVHCFHRHVAPHFGLLFPFSVFLFNIFYCCLSMRYEIITWPKSLRNLKSINMDKSKISGKFPSWVNHFFRVCKENTSKSGLHGNGSFSRWHYIYPFQSTMFFCDFSQVNLSNKLAKWSGLRSHRAV